MFLRQRLHQIVRHDAHLLLHDRYDTMSLATGMVSRYQPKIRSDDRVDTQLIHGCNARERCSLERERE